MWSNGAITWKVEVQTLKEADYLFTEQTELNAEEEGEHQIILSYKKNNAQDSGLFLKTWILALFHIYSVQLLTFDLIYKNIPLSQKPQEVVVLNRREDPEIWWLVIFHQRMKNILKQHLLLEDGQCDLSVAKQPLWLLFCCAGRLTRFFSQGCISLIPLQCGKHADIKDGALHNWCVRQS